MNNRQKLTDDALQNSLNNLPLWEQKENKIIKTFQFANYKDINKFLPHLAETIVANNHHPNFNFNGSNKTLEITLWSHDAGGVTASDIEFANTLEAWNSN